MVKRPLVLLTLFYLFGILAERKRLYFGAVFSVLLIILLFFLLWGKISRFLREKIFSCRKGKISSFFVWKVPAKIFCLVPFCFAAGYLLAQQAGAAGALERYVQDGVEGCLEGKVISSTQGQSTGRMVLSAAKLEGAQGEVKGEKILVYIPGEKLFAPGSTVRVYGKWTALSRGDNPGQFDEYSYYKAQGICAKGTAESVELVREEKSLKAALWKLKQKMKQVYGKVLPQTEAGVLEAMFLAEKGGLESEIKEMYQDAGFSHILAVSGMHLSLLGMGFYRLLKRLRAGSNPAAAAACAMVLLYSIFTGAGIPVVRAAVMLLLTLLAAPAGKTYDAPTGLSAAALVILAREPLQLFQAGFLLSFGAVVGILMFSRLFEQMGIRKLGANLGVQLVLLPLLFWFYYEVPVYALLLNLLVIPFLSLLLLLAVLIGVFGNIWIFLGKFFAGGAYVLLKGYEALCHLNERLPGKRFCYGRPEFWQMVLYYVILLGFYLLCKKRKSRKNSPFPALLFLSLLAGVFLLPAEKGEFSVTYLAVGQGDCAVLQKGKTTVLIDAGSSVKNGAERILVPYLKYHGDTEIEYVMLSHTDEDHCSMLIELLEGMAAGDAQVKVGTIVLTEAAKKEEKKYAMLCGMAEAAGVSCVLFSAGDKLMIGGEELICLSPQAQEDFGDANQNSMVLALSSENVFCLFTGDIAAAQEKKVAEELERSGLFAPGQARFLKTAHHGSRYSSCSELLQYFSGQKAVISCGKNNRYGHPHEETAERMAKAGVEAVITWQSGAVRMKGGELYAWKPYLAGKGAWE